MMYHSRWMSYIKSLNVEFFSGATLRRFAASPKLHVQGSEHQMGRSITTSAPAAGCLRRGRSTKGPKDGKGTQKSHVLEVQIPDI